MEKSDIGALLRARRISLRLTQKYVADSAGVPRVTLGRLERGQCDSIGTAVATATFLGVHFVLNEDTGYRAPEPPVEVMPRRPHPRREKTRFERRHGTDYMYLKAKCRCEDCVAKYKARVDRGREAARKAMLDPNSPRHGHMYAMGCTCTKCYEGRMRSIGRIPNEVATP